MPSLRRHVYVLNNLICISGILRNKNHYMATILHWAMQHYYYLYKLWRLLILVFVENKALYQE